MDRRHIELFEGAALPLANDGEGGQHDGHDLDEDREHTWDQEVGGTRVRIEENLGAGLDRKGLALRCNRTCSLDRFPQGDGVGDIERLIGYGGFRPVDKDEKTGRLPGQQSARIVRGDVQPDARDSVDDRLVESLFRLNGEDDLEVVRIDKTIEQSPTLLGSGSIEHDRPHISDIGVDGETDHEHLQKGNEDGHEEGHRVAADVNRLFPQDRERAAEWVSSSVSQHRLAVGGPPITPHRSPSCAPRSASRRHLRGLDGWGAPARP